MRAANGVRDPGKPGSSGRTVTSSSDAGRGYRSGTVRPSRVPGAAPVGELERMIADAGFSHIKITVKTQSRDLVQEWSPGTGAANVVASALIEATKLA